MNKLFTTVAFTSSFNNRTHWPSFGMAGFAGFIPGATCLVLSMSILPLIFS